jgi:hypothetical protein
MAIHNLLHYNAVCFRWHVCGDQRDKFSVGGLPFAVSYIICEVLSWRILSWQTSHRKVLTIWIFMAYIGYKVIKYTRTLDQAQKYLKKITTLVCGNSTLLLVDVVLYL